MFVPDRSVALGHTWRTDLLYYNEYTLFSMWS